MSAEMPDIWHPCKEASVAYQGSAVFLQAILRSKAVCIPQFLAIQQYMSSLQLGPVFPFPLLLQGLGLASHTWGVAQKGAGEEVLAVSKELINVMCKYGGPQFYRY